MDSNEIYDKQKEYYLNEVYELDCMFRDWINSRQLEFTYESYNRWDEFLTEPKNAEMNQRIKKGMKKFRDYVTELIHNEVPVLTNEQVKELYNRGFSEVHGFDTLSYVLGYINHKYKDVPLSDFAVGTIWGEKSKLLGWD